MANYMLPFPISSSSLLESFWNGVLSYMRKSLSANSLRCNHEKINFGSGSVVSLVGSTSSYTGSGC